jgi:proteasome activator subunit 4
MSAVVSEPDAFLSSLQSPVNANTYLVDKMGTGFVAWTSEVKAYTPARQDAVLQWEDESRPALEAMSQVMAEAEFFATLTQLWSQESSRNGGSTEIRGDNVTFMKSLSEQPTCFSSSYSF